MVSETKSFTHNLHEFINNDVELLRNQVTYTFTNATPHEENLSLVEFATRIFQRQRNMPNKAHVEIAGTVSTLAKVFAQNDWLSDMRCYNRHIRHRNVNCYILLGGMS